MHFVLQLLIEKLRNNSQEALVTFIDYSKAFDSVIHTELFATMDKMGFPKHLTRLIEGLYKDQKATIRWNRANCEYFDIKKRSPTRLHPLTTSFQHLHTGLVIFLIF